jgi:ketosteroid isomerase-like protein
MRGWFTSGVGNVELARDGFEAALRGDLEAIAALLDPDVKWHGGDPSSGCQNRNEALALIRNGLARMNDVELVDVVGAGDKVVVLLRRPGDPDPVANVTTFRNGKVVEMVHYPDPADALAVVGH